MPRRDHARRIGLALSATDDPTRLTPWLADLALVVVDFAAFTDGRGFSQARLLRSRLDYPGPIRAGGTILPDQVPALTTRYEAAFVLGPARELDGWVLLCGRRRP